MKYIVSYYTDVYYEFTCKIVEFLMWVALVAILIILISYLCTSSKWKKAYILIHYSMYITPLLYAICFLVLRFYISVPLIIFFCLFLFHTEKTELKKLSNQFYIPDSISIKLSNKYIIIACTFFIITLILGYMYYKFVL